MALKFYRYYGDSRKLNKVLGSPIKTVSTFKLKEDCSVYNPTLIIAYDSALNPNEASKWANYLVDDGANRYYFIRDVVRKPNGTLEITCEEDVLTTFKSQISAMTVIINRSTVADGGEYIPDDKMIMDVRETIHTIPISGSGVTNPLDGNDKTIIMCCAGPAFSS